jgi:hypothetical protein
MAKGMMTFAVTELEWLKIHLRLAALEHSGERLSYRFDFRGDLSKELTCHIYFRDDDSNSIKAECDSGLREIYEGWMNLAGEIMRSAFQEAHLGANFHWQPNVRYILYEGYGMGSSIQYKAERVFDVR